MLQMNAKEQLKLDVVGRVSSGKISFKNALNLLNVSESTLFRYLRQYELEGIKFVKHKNSNRRPANKTNTELEKKIVELCKEKYFDFNRTHAREYLKEKNQIDIPKDTFNRICNRHNILIKNQKRKKKQTRTRRDRMAQKGLMLQMDGSPHRWFGSRKTCLVIAIDDATSDILYGEFSATETTFACMKVTKKILRDYGVFQILYTDRAGIFGKDPISHFDAVKRDGFSALKDCLSYFKIHVIYAYSPEAKGRVERAFKTLQDRLVAEFRLNNIFNIEDANRYFNEVYLPKHRKQFCQEAESAFLPIIPSLNLDDLFYTKEKRVIKNDHTFSLANKIYDITNIKENCSGKEIEIRSYPEGQVRYFVDDKEVSLKELKSKVA